jgi:threonine dehydratase
VLAERRANVLEVSHQRAFAGVELGETVVDATVETRGPEHVSDILRALAAAGYDHRRRLL